MAAIQLVIEGGHGLYAHFDWKRFEEPLSEGVNVCIFKLSGLYECIVNMDIYDGTAEIIADHFDKFCADNEIQKPNMDTFVNFLDNFYDI